MKWKREQLEKSEVQSLVFSGYSKNAYASYLFLSINDVAKARSWLDGLGSSLTFGENDSYALTTNVALSAPALAALGLDAESLATFPLEFREGLRLPDDAHRPRVLGDTGESAPSRWLWGGPSTAPVHFMLMLSAASEAELAAGVEAQRQRFAGALDEVYTRSTRRLDEEREHFGFTDGLSQPRIEGQKARPNQERAIKAGEFLLGYENEFGKLPTTPSVPATSSASSSLRPLGNGSRGGPPARRDFGRNGSFLVVRQLEQDVERFWESMERFSKADGGAPDRERAVWLAAKCVGRWPGGAPLVRSPDRDDPAWSKDNAFTYSADPEGFACPIGSHIRKANPRDSLEPGPKQSLMATNRRRILRRGRAYGPPLAPFEHEAQRQERGLLFICLNTNIRRQFEFIQQSWLNNEKFAGLYADQDPIVGDQLPGAGSTFTIPQRPLRRRLVGIERFVEVRGGAYLFLPSRSALRYLSQAPSPAARLTSNLGPTGRGAAVIG